MVQDKRADLQHNYMPEQDNAWLREISDADLSAWLDMRSRENPLLVSQLPPSTKEHVSSEHVTPHEALFKMHNYWRYQIFELVGHETECAAPCVTLIATIVVTSSRASLCSLQATHRQQPLRKGKFMPCQKLPMSGMHFLQPKEI